MIFTTPLGLLMGSFKKLIGREMNSNFRIVLGLGLIGITIYDVVVSGFDYKHAIFLGIASLAIYFAIAKK